MPPLGYKSVTIPADLLEEVERLMVEFKGKEGFAQYRNVTDFVKDAVRHRIEELRRIYWLGEPEARSPPARRGAK